MLNCFWYGEGGFQVSKKLEELGRTLEKTPSVENTIGGLEQKIENDSAIREFAGVDHFLRKLDNRVSVKVKKDLNYSSVIRPVPLKLNLELITNQPETSFENLTNSRIYNDGVGGINIELGAFYSLFNIGGYDIVEDALEKYLGTLGVIERSKDLLIPISLLSEGMVGTTEGGTILSGIANL